MSVVLDEIGRQVQAVFVAYWADLERCDWHSVAAVRACNLRLSITLANVFGRSLTILISTDRQVFYTDYILLSPSVIELSRIVGGTEWQKLRVNCKISDSSVKPSGAMFHQGFPFEIAYSLGAARGRDLLEPVDLDEALLAGRHAFEA
jgi:hypothetical protein